MSRASDRGLFYLHKHHLKWFRKHQFNPQLFRHQRDIKTKDLSIPCQSWTSPVGLRGVTEDFKWSTWQTERAECETEHKNKDNAKAPRQVSSPSFLAFLPVSRRDSMKHWGCWRNKHTNGLSLIPSNKTGNQGVAIETVNFKWPDSDRAGAVNIMNGAVVVMVQSWCFTAPCTWKWNRQKTESYFPGQDTWDFLCYLQTPVVHDCGVTYINTAHMHTLQYLKKTISTCRNTHTC